MSDLVVWNNEHIVSDLTGQLSVKSQRVYRHDAKVFATWMIENGLTVESLTRSHVILYRAYLNNTYQKATAARMLSVARRLLDEAVNNGKIIANPAKNVKGFRLNNETPYTALTKQQAKELLQAIDRSSVLGKRDYALILLLLRTGIRRSECAALTIGSIKMEQGHRIAIIEHGKGDKRRIVKLPVDAFRSIDDYLKVARRRNDSPQAPLFTGCTKGLQSTSLGISDKLIERTVQKYAKLIGIHSLTPHGLRATFVTLAMEGGATLEQVQYTVGHSDPRTTERYQKRKLNLDDNAVDYIKL